MEGKKLIRKASDVVDFKASTSAADILGRECDLEYVETNARYKVSGYGRHDIIYRVVGTDDAIVVWNDTDRGNLVGGIRLEQGFFASRRAYGKRCREVAARLGITTEAVLAVGPEYADELAAATENVSVCQQGSTAEKCRYHRFNDDEGIVLHKEDVHVLQRCGIHRRKVILAHLLRPHVSAELLELISSMGQKNSARLADFLLGSAGLKKGYH